MKEEKDNLEEKEVIKKEQQENVKESLEEVIEENKEAKIEAEKEKKTKNNKESDKEVKEAKIEKKEDEKKDATEKKVQIKKIEEKPKTEKKKRKPVIPIIITTVLICFLIIFSIIFALININNDKILSGITIMGIDVSNLSQEEAMKKIQEMIDNKETSNITLKYDEYETTINGKQFSIKFDLEKTVNEAYNIGKDSNIIVNNYNILFTQIFKKDINMSLCYDEEALNSKIQDISSKMPGAVKQSSYYVEDEKLIIVKGTSGTKIKEDEIKQQIINIINDLDSKNDIITIPLEEVEPDAIDLEKIRNEIYKEPKDAYVSKNPTTVHTHVNGVDFKISIEEAQKLIEEDKTEYIIPLKITVPNKTVKDLGEEAFPDLLATYTTRYDASNYNRSTNLTLAASKINGTVLMPDEVFSYNKVVGERTIEAGYKEAGAYSGGGLVQSVGGGICQISSTVYNTALLANLEIVDRSNHQFQTSYVPVSRDATVSWGYLDFKFKNTRTYPIKIVASAKNGVAEVSFYGIKEKTEYEVVIQSKVTSYIPYTVKYIEDDTLEEGKEVVEESGYNGCKSEAYRILKLDGKVVSQTLLSRDTYDPMQRIVRKGTKKKEEEKKTTNNKTNNKTTTSTTQTTTNANSTQSQTTTKPTASTTSQTTIKNPENGSTPTDKTDKIVNE